MNKFIGDGPSREELENSKKKKINWVKVGIIGGCIFVALIVLIVVFASSMSKDTPEEQKDPKEIWKNSYYEFLASANTLRGSTKSQGVLIDFDNNEVPELVVITNIDGDREMTVFYIKDEKVRKSRRYTDAELKLMYEINTKEAKWYLSEIDEGINFYTDLKELVNDNEVVSKKKNVEETYEDTLTEVLYKNLSAGSLESDLGALFNSYNKDYYINDSLDTKMEKILRDRANSGNINEVYKTFIVDKKYNNYIHWLESPNKYAYYDLNGDGTKELIISYQDNNQWYRLLIMTFDEKTKTLYKAGEIYCYRGLYINTINKDFYYFDTQPSGTVETTLFYKLEKNSLVMVRKAMKENGKFYKLEPTNTYREQIENLEYTKYHNGYSNTVITYSNILDVQ